MTFDDDLANRVRELLAKDPDTTEKRMFGGLAFLVNGHMSVSVSRLGGLLVRVAPSETQSLLARANVFPFEMRGREMTGWLRVDDAGLRTKRQLQSWVDRSVSYARSVPPKR